MRATIHGRRLGELTLAGLLGTLVLAGGAAPPGTSDAGSADGETALRASEEVAFPVVEPTLLDSLRTESALPPPELRQPLERVLARYTDDRLLVRRISRAVVRESRRQQVPPSLIAAVLLTENTTLRPEAESPVGARGLMQVMPFHAGAKLCNSDDLVDVDSNICHGTLILARNLRASASSAEALLRYNGCVRGTNTPDCHRYPDRVLARAGKVRREILAAADPAERERADAGPPMELAGR